MAKYRQNLIISVVTKLHQFLIILFARTHTHPHIKSHTRTDVAVNNTCLPGIVGTQVTSFIVNATHTPDNKKCTWIIANP